MPRVFVPSEQLSGERVVLEGEAHRHLAKVLRLEAGHTLVIFDGGGTEIDARVLSVGPRTIELVLGDRRAVSLAAASITLLQAVPKGDRMDLIVQKATELGVAQIVPVVAGRSVVRPSSMRSRRWQTIAQEAARQSGRADVPQVTEPLLLAEAVARATTGARFVLWEEEHGQSLRRGLEGGAREVTLLIGPEGGLAVEEVVEARTHGFVPVGLGPRILRVETAAIVAVALVQAAAGGLD
jgi:16S rRNA (uracil1498-N3)-methyltransferase